MSPREATALEARVEAGLSRVDEAGDERGTRSFDQIVAGLPSRGADASDPQGEPRVGRDVADSLARGLAAAERAAAHRKSLACYPDDPEAHGVGDLGRAVDACERVDAWRTCSFARAAETAQRDARGPQGDAERLCPRVRERAPVLAAAARLTAARVPIDEARILLAEVPGVRRNGVRERTLSPWPEGETGPTKTARAVDAFLRPNDPRRILVLLGPTGQSKTIAACRPLRDRPGRYVHAKEFERPNDALYAECLAAELLVVDEVGTEHVGAGLFASSQIASLLCRRIAGEGVSLLDEIDGRGPPRALRTIVTGNLLPRQEREGDPPGFFDRYGQAVEDRVKARGEVVTVVGKSYRRPLSSPGTGARRP